MSNTMSKTELLASVTALGADQANADNAKKDKGLAAPKFAAHIAIMRGAAQGTVTADDVPALMSAFYEKAGVTLSKGSAAKSRAHMMGCIKAAEHGVSTLDVFTGWVNAAPDDAEKGKRGKRAFSKFIETILPRVNATKRPLVHNELIALLDNEKAPVEVLAAALGQLAAVLDDVGTNVLPAQAANLAALAAALTIIQPHLDDAAEQAKAAREKGIDDKFKPAADASAASVLTPVFKVAA